MRPPGLSNNEMYKFPGDPEIWGFVSFFASSSVSLCSAYVHTRNLHSPKGYNLAHATVSLLTVILRMDDILVPTALMTLESRRD